MDFDRFDAVLRVAGNDDAAVGQSFGVELFPNLLGQGGAAGEVYLAAVSADACNIHIHVAGEVLRQVVRYASPLLHQAGVDVLLVLDVGTARPEEGLEGLGAQLLGAGVVLAAQPEAGT